MQRFYLGGRFVLAIKDEGTKKEAWKARFVVQGYRDKLKTSLVHDTATPRQHYTRSVIGLAAIGGFRLFSTDVTQAYLQSAEQVMRDVYIKPTGEFELNQGKLLKLLKPLYGLADRGDYWGRTISNHIKEDLNMTGTTSDGAFFFRCIRERLDGMCITYVEDALKAGTKEYSDLAHKIEEKFKCKGGAYDKFNFVGVQVEKKDTEYMIHQTSYIRKIEKLSNTATYKSYRSLRAKLAWITYTTPDISFSIAQAAQVTESQYNTDSKLQIRYINRTIKRLRKEPYLPLKYPKLDDTQLQIRVYSEASYANNSDSSSQLGYLIFLCDGSNLCQPLYWSSHKAKRVSRSVLGSETMAFADSVDMAFMIRHDIQKMMSIKIPILMFTDSLSLFDVITKASTTIEKRLMIDLEVVKKAYQQK